MMYQEHDRIIVVGGPCCGKTTLSNSFKRPVFHTDDLILDNPFTSGRAIADWIDRPAPWVIEGVTATLALRFWLKAHSEIDAAGHPVVDMQPCDCVLQLWQPLIRLTQEQQSMLDMLKAQWLGIQSELHRRSVTIRTIVVQRQYVHHSA